MTARKCPTRKRSTPPNRGRAKWRVKGLSTNLASFLEEFAKTLTALEHADLVGAQEHLEYVLENWSND